MMNTELEGIVALALNAFGETADEFGLSDDACDFFELRFRRELMKKYCTNVNTPPTTYSGTHLLVPGSGGSHWVHANTATGKAQLNG